MVKQAMVALKTAKNHSNYYEELLDNSRFCTLHIKWGWQETPLACKIWSTSLFMQTGHEAKFTSKRGLWLMHIIMTFPGVNTDKAGLWTSECRSFQRIFIVDPPLCSPGKSTWEFHPHSSCLQHCQTLHSSWAQKTMSQVVALQRIHTHLQQPVRVTIATWMSEEQTNVKKNPRPKTSNTIITALSICNQLPK